MKKFTFVFFIIFTLIPQSVFGDDGASLKKALLKVADLIANDTYIPKNENIAILGFQETTTKSRYALSSIIEEDLTNYLIQKKPGKIIVKSSIDTVLNELKISRDDIFDPKNRKAFGRLVSAGLLISGTYWIDNKDVVINITVIDVQSGIAFYSYKTRVKKSEVKQYLNKERGEFKGAVDE